jgi:hypothetical protein
VRQPETGLVGYRYFLLHLFARQPGAGFPFNVAPFLPNSGGQPATLFNRRRQVDQPQLLLLICGKLPLKSALAHAKFQFPRGRGNDVFAAGHRQQTTNYRETSEALCCSNANNCDDESAHQHCITSSNNDTATDDYRKIKTA